MGRSNIPLQNAMSIGEEIVLRFTIRDSSNAPIQSFAGWNVSWFLLENMEVNGSVEELTEKSIIHKDQDSGVDLSNAPYVDVSLLPTDTLSVPSGNYAYELWRTDTGNIRRLAYGTFPLLD